MKQIVFHIGYPKTATSTLQKEIFPKIRNVKYEGNALRSSGKIEKEVLKKKSSLLLSNERVLSLKYGYEGKSKKIHKQTYNREPESKIIFTIRNQADIIKSAFTFYYGFFEKKGYNDINEMVLKEIGEKGKTEIEGWVDYERVVNEFSSVFGRESVCVLKFEDFTNNRKDFFRALSNVVGESSDYLQKISENCASHNVQPKKGKKHSKPSKLYTWLSHFKSDHLSKMGPLSEYPFGKYIKRLASSFNEEVSLSKKSKKIIQKRYSDPNRRLFDEFNLRNYGEYPLSEDS